MLNIFNKFFDSNSKEINNLGKIIEVINSLEGKYKKLSDKKLSESFSQFRKDYQNGKTLDELLPEVYAAVREAGRRTLGLRMYDVQLIASMVLHKGKIAEQKTGEGKTLSAVPALFLNAIEGRGVHLVTVNDYLSRRDCGWMGPIYHALGASCATLVHEQAFIYDPKFLDRSHTDERLQHLRPILRQEAYQADITYGTNNEYGFDYLRDNMVYSLRDKAQRGHYFAIVDEVDSILIDEARTPLIISRPAQEATEKYYDFANLVSKLSKESDYEIDEKLRTAHLTEHGILKIEKALGVENLYEKDFSILHHIEQALKARTLFQKDKDYVVREKEVIIVDEFTGRLMPGRRYSEGLHQAIEAKEGVPIQQESQTLATISFQNYFRMYEKLAGMTGTAATEAEEFYKIYKLEVVVIPTNKPMVRTDHPDIIYKTQKAKYTAVANEVEKIYKTGQPVLVGTTSIEKNEFLSSLLKHKKISHAILNAKNHEKEAEIIEKAGQLGVVTVATNMAGRGVDIKLGEGIDRLGGLYVIGTERHESRRIDNQLRGRSGRQGDPGASRFYVSLEDDLMRIFGGDQVARVMNLLKIPEDMPIENAMVSKALESAQGKVEGHNFDSRKTTVEYDDVMNKQRQILYGIRDKVLEAAQKVSEKGNLGLKEETLGKVNSGIASLVMVHSQSELNTNQAIDLDKIVQGFVDILPLDPNSQKQLKDQLKKLESPDQIIEHLTQIAYQAYEGREGQVGSEVGRQMEVFTYLTTIDTLWIEHLDTIDDLRAGINLRAFGQREPLVEYKREAFSLFEKLVANIDYEIVHRIFKVAVNNPELQTQPVINLTQAMEQHEEALDEDKSLEGAGYLVPQTPEPFGDEKKLPSGSGTTKVTVERDGQVISQNIHSGNTTLNASGKSQTNPHKKLGRNDPCWCGKLAENGKPVKYKKCHYPN